MTALAITDLDLAKACAGSYAADAVEHWSGRDERVHVYLAMIVGAHVIIHEGTTAWPDRTDPSSLPEWLIDFDAAPVTSPHAAYGRVHQGLMLDVQSVMPQIFAYLEGLGWPPFVLTGHSKGGGEVILSHAEFKANGHAPAKTRAFEPPQVGGKALSDYLAGEDIAWTQTVNAEGRDLVTRIPEGLQIPYLTSWAHIGDPIRLIVPDSYDVSTKHRIATVIEALGGI